jgi:hypothetical protein
MIFGDPAIFAVEVHLEPGPDFKTVVGRNIAGRVCIHIANKVFGDIDEPLCVFRPISKPLLEISAPEPPCANIT